MSWSFELTGTKLGVTKAVAETCDKLAAGYAGKEEGKDILVVKDRVLSIIDALDMDANGYTVCNAVTAKGNGSHYTTTKGVGHADCHFSVTRTSLAL